MDKIDPFVTESQRARELVVEQLRALWRDWSPDAKLDVLTPSSPTAPSVVVRSRNDRSLAAISAHAGGASVLVGEQARLCAFDEGTPEERALRVYGAVACLLVGDEAGEREPPRP